MAKISVTRELQATRGRYVATIEGSPDEAELTFTRPEPAIFSANHTGTPVSMRGQGIATMLVERMVVDARREGFKIRPACPFVVALFDQHPDWSDLQA